MTASPEHTPLRLRVATADLVASHPANERPVQYLQILEAQIQDLAPYAPSAQWLADFCEGFFIGAAGSIFVQPLTKRTDPPDTPRDPSWTTLTPAAQLEGAVYEFVPSKSTDSFLFCKKNESSATSEASADSSMDFRAALIRRDVGCILTGDEPSACIASHIVPKRLGDDRINSILSWANCANPSGRFDMRVGILVTATIDRYIDDMHLCFRKVVRPQRKCIRHPDPTWQGQDTYMVQQLAPGGIDEPVSMNPRLHGRIVTLPSHRNEQELPPAIIYQWHYVQCVLTRFGKDLPAEGRLCYLNIPFRTRTEKEDSDDDQHFRDGGGTALYPQQQWDDWMEEAMTKTVAKERVGGWLQGVNV
jgi:hypothetical protein